MKRTAFLRRIPARRPATQYEGENPSSPRAVVVSAPALPMGGEPEPKHVYVRSPTLMKAYRTIGCTWCGAMNQTVCGAHSNWSIHGKGMQIKADDSRCASLCDECHRAIDQGSRLTELERKRIWHTSFVRTIHYLTSLKRWPIGVPVPSLEWPPEWGPRYGEAA